MANAGGVFLDQAGDIFLNLGSPVVPTALFAAALVGGNTDSSGGGPASEVVLNGGAGGINYARPSFGAGAFNVAGGVYTLAADLTFNQATGGAWGLITAIIIVASTAVVPLSATSVVMFKNLDVADQRQIDDTDTLRLPAGTDFTITIV